MTRTVGLLGCGAAVDLGGVPTHVRALSSHLRQRGWRVPRLALDASPERPLYAVHRDPAPGGERWTFAYRYHDHRTWDDLSEHALAERVVRAWLAETRPTLVHVHHLTGFGVGVLREIARHGTPIVMTLHDYWTICPRGQLFAHDEQACEQPVAKRCAECLRATWPQLAPSTDGCAPTVAAAERLRAQLQALDAVDLFIVPARAAARPFERAGLAPERMHIVENGIEVDELSAAVAAERAAAPQRSGLRLGVLGAVQPSKGVLALARAFHAADLSGAPPVELLIHGPLVDYHGDDREVRELRRLSELDDRIRLMGPYPPDKLPQVLTELDAVAAPSRWPEVFGLGVREARAAGLGVLVSDQGGLPDVARAGRAGLVVPTGPEADPGAWQRALERWAGDAALRAAWAAAPVAVRTAREMVDELERAYARVLGRESTNP